MGWNIGGIQMGGGGSAYAFEEKFEGGTDGAVVVGQNSAEAGPLYNMTPNVGLDYGNTSTNHALVIFTSQGRNGLGITRSTSYQSGFGATSMDKWLFGYTHDIDTITEPVPEGPVHVEAWYKITDTQGQWGRSLMHLRMQDVTRQRPNYNPPEPWEDPNHMTFSYTTTGKGTFDRRSPTWSGPYGEFGIFVSTTFNIPLNTWLLWSFDYEMGVEQRATVKDESGTVIYDSGGEGTPAQHWQPYSVGFVVTDYLGTRYVLDDVAISVGRGGGGWSMGEE